MGCIDYVIIKQKDKRMCLNMTVMRSAEYNTDHQVMHVPIRMDWHSHGQKEGQKRDRHDVLKLMKSDKNLKGESQQSMKKRLKSYLDCVVEKKARTERPKDGKAENKWENMHTAIIKRSSELLGMAKCI